MCDQKYSINNAALSNWLRFESGSDFIWETSLLYMYL